MKFPSWKFRMGTNRHLINFSASKSDWVFSGCVLDSNKSCIGQSSVCVPIDTLIGSVDVDADIFVLVHSHLLCHFS